MDADDQRPVAAVVGAAAAEGEPDARRAAEGRAQRVAGEGDRLEVIPGARVPGGSGLLREQAAAQRAI